MASRQDSLEWDAFLPRAYEWLEKVKIVYNSELSAGSQVVVPCLFKDGPQLGDSGLSQALQTAIRDKAQQVGWGGESSITLEAADHRVHLVPVSKLAVADSQKGREVGFQAATFLKDVSKEGLCFASGSEVKAAAVIEGFSEGLYDTQLFYGKRKDLELPVSIAYLGQEDESSITEAVARARASLFARMLQDAPANWLNPVKWAEIAKKHFAGKVDKIEVLGREELVKQGMGSYLSVAAGSPIEPQLISIKIKGKSSKRKIALVGKGLTFDAGGISLKPSLGMGEMKYDMSGGSAVMGAAHYLAEVTPEHDVHCLIGAVENMPSGTATRPGDIVQAKNGKTIEVLNTDAEGRLVLADVLAYACEDKPDLIVDLATLTGAVLHGLGHAGAAVMTPNQSVANLLLKVGRDQGEPLWQLPLWPELDKEVKSEIADLKNIAKPNVMAGTIIGGVFLKEFVTEGTKWAHMDIAGTGWSCTATGYPKSGGSGFGIRTITQLCSELDV